MCFLDLQTSKKKYLQRENALSVMGTVAHHRKLEEIYNLGTIQTQEQES